MENPSKERKYYRKAWLKWIIPLGLSIVITVITYFPSWIESVYAVRLYPYIALTQRTITGWLPFSLGDIIYFVLGLWLVIKFIITIRAAIKKKITAPKTMQRFLRLAILLMWVYIIFSLAWGWNYHRKGPAYQLQLPVGRYTSYEIKQLLDEVITRLNNNRRLVSADTIMPGRSFQELAQGAFNAYSAAAVHYPFLHYPVLSVKKSMYSSAAEYFGFTGYYNPFTGEAQLRTALPEVMKPFVLCHEVGHQLGYAKENEASFAGYLAASSSNDPYFRYSVYLDMYSSVRVKLLMTSLAEGDTTVMQTLQQYNQQLDTLVRFDRRKIRAYFNRNQTAFSEQMSSVIMSMYEQYLKANKQAAGLKSYDDVVSLLIAFRRKYGHI